jgi:hypothetical protein
MVLALAPGGLASLAGTVRDAWLRRVASRHRIVVPSLIADRRADAGGLIPIAPRQRASGAAVFVPARYRPTSQWMVDARVRKQREASS